MCRGPAPRSPGGGPSFYGSLPLLPCPELRACFFRPRRGFTLQAPPGPQVTSMYPGSQSCHSKLRDSPPFPQTSSSGAKGLAFPGWVRGSKGPSTPKRPKAMLPHRASPRETCPRSCHVGHNLCQSRDSGSIDQSLFALHRKGPPCMQVPWPSTMMGL